jgi:hypothetical protein
MPRLIQRFAWSSPPQWVRRRFSGSFNALARRGALTPRASTPVAQLPRQAGRLASMGDPDVHSFQCYLHICEALNRESAEDSSVDHPSSLRSATSVALTKVAFFAYLLFLRITTYARSRSSLSRSSKEKVLRRDTAFQRPALNLTSVLMSVAKLYYSDND